MTPREKIHRLDPGALTISFLLAASLEVGSLVAMFSMMGHAGPEGPFALVGWIATAFNLPGLFLGAFLQLPPDTSTFKMGVAIFLIQIPLVWYVTFVIVRLMKMMFKMVFARLRAGN